MTYCCSAHTRHAQLLLIFTPADSEQLCTHGLIRVAHFVVCVLSIPSCSVPFFTLSLFLPPSGTFRTCFSVHPGMVLLSASAGLWSRIHWRNCAPDERGGHRCRCESVEGSNELHAGDSESEFRARESHGERSRSPQERRCDTHSMAPDSAGVRSRPDEHMCSHSQRAARSHGCSSREQSCQLTRAWRIRQLLDSFSPSLAQEHFTASRQHDRPRALSLSDRAIARKKFSKSNPVRASSGSRPGSGSFGILRILLLILTAAAFLVPTCRAAIQRGSAVLTPSGVLEMTASWVDSPQEGVM